MTTPTPETLGRYHPRRMDKDMPDPAEQLAVLRAQSALTLAMCRGDEPYLVSLDYVYAAEENCFYAHGATEGKKLDILRVNARVWGQVVEDRGAVAGRCTHSYRCVMFDGKVEIVADRAAKLRALERLIEKYEPDPAAMKKRMLSVAQIDKVEVLRIRVSAFSGKRSPAVD
jgi:nitroimidazol reductase NimA-like FMN-containing flavoprotein (pyridoxamine 5'-phosphate oxidase superfamily)